jgi:hypothetical protein
VQATRVLGALAVLGGFREPLRAGACVKLLPARMVAADATTVDAAAGPGGGGEGSSMAHAGDAPRRRGRGVWARAGAARRQAHKVRAANELRASKRRPLVLGTPPRTHHIGRPNSQGPRTRLPTQADFLGAPKAVRRADAAGRGRRRTGGRQIRPATREARR